VKLVTKRYGSNVVNILPVARPTTKSASTMTLLSAKSVQKPSFWKKGRRRPSRAKSM